MNKSILLLCLFVNFAIGQNKPVDYKYTTSQPLTTDKLINDGEFSDNGKLIKSLTIVYDGDINRFSNKLCFDLGNVDIVSNHPHLKTIYFRKFKRADWSENKLTVFFQSQSFQARNMVTFTCVDNKGNDCLADPITKQKIITYLEEVLSFVPKVTNNETEK